MSSLVGKVALVTGASRGIGRAIAVRLANQGALVGVHYGSNLDAAQETAKLIANDGGQSFLVQARLGVPGDADALWTAFDTALAGSGVGPGLDILVNNAGIVANTDIHTATPDAFDELFAVNVRAPFFVVQKGLSRLRDNGRIINISSAVTRVALPDILAYSMTKGALDTFSFTLAKALGSRNITVNSVSPGVTDTDMNASWLRGNADAQALYSSESALGRIGESDDIADIVGFVATSGSRWITGQAIDATGGLHL